jgi:hypothetical protein
MATLVPEQRHCSIFLWKSHTALPSPILQPPNFFP